MRSFGNNSPLLPALRRGERAAGRRYRSRRRPLKSIGACDQTRRRPRKSIGACDRTRRRPRNSIGASARAPRLRLRAGRLRGALRKTALTNKGRCSALFAFPQNAHGWPRRSAAWDFFGCGRPALENAIGRVEACGRPARPALKNAVGRVGLCGRHGSVYAVGYVRSVRAACGGSLLEDRIFDWGGFRSVSDRVPAGAD
jgi:hypothetical protein